MSAGGLPEGLREGVAKFVHSNFHSGIKLDLDPETCSMCADSLRKADALLAPDGPLGALLADFDSTFEAMQEMGATELRLRAALTEAEGKLDRLRVLAHSGNADKFRDEAARGVAALPYASNRYLHLIDDLRRILDGSES